MWFVKCIKTGKRIFCWLLVFVLIAGQSVSFVYGDDTEGLKGQTTYAIGDVVEVEGIKYRICDGYAEVQEGQNTGLSGDIVIQDRVSDGTVSYPVTVIGDKAFYECVDIESVVIPEGVISIGRDAFYKCNSLVEVKLPVTLQTIGVAAFSNCIRLTSIEIPDGITSIEEGAFNGCVRLTSIGIPDGITSIEEGMFANCHNLASIVIPDSVICIEDYAFASCWSLEEIKLSENLLSIGFEAFFGCSDSLKMVEIPNLVTTAPHAFRLADVLKTAKISDRLTIDYTFYGCKSLETLQIKVTMRTGNVVEPVKNVSGIDGFDYRNIDGNTVTEELNRKLEFWTEDGSAKLTGTELKAAQEAYLAVEDGDTSDNLWYGWQVLPAYEVTVNVNKDGTAWADHDRTFKLTEDNGSSYIDLSSVVDGIYQIYDVTDTANIMDTGVTVEVNGSNVTSNPVNYYTVTFYDDADHPYGNDTGQKPQVVLSGTQAAIPADPEKANYRFGGWMKDEEGETAFDFNGKITDTTNIYAKWTENPVKRQHTITASAGEGGSISPNGSIIVDDGKNQEFLIVPDEGYAILSVKADGVELGAEGTYTFANVTENHSIRAEFIKKDSGEIKPTEPVKPEDPTEPTQPENPTEPSNPETPTEPTQPEPPTEPDNQGTPGDSDGADDADISDTPTNPGETNGSTNSSKKDNEPVTSGLSHTDMYATTAMIAGISYLLLYFIEKKQGMSEEEKNKLIASLIAWAKEGAGSQKGIKRVIALILIVLILFYYHAIGKKLSLEWQSAN